MPKNRENWDTWFQDYRVPNETGEQATQEDWDNLDKAIPELNKIEEQLQDKNSELYSKYQTWASEGYKQDNLKQPDPRVFIAKEYYRKNHPEFDYEHPWYSGQARWETQYQYPGQSEASSTDKVTRFPYYSKNGMTWWSNSPNYAKTFAEYYDSRAHGSRYRGENNPEASVTGEVFQAYFPKDIKSSLNLTGPTSGYDHWVDLPFEITDGYIYRKPKAELIPRTRDTDYRNYTDQSGNHLEVNGTGRRNNAFKTDDVVDAANKQGYTTVYLHNVGDGFMMEDADNYKHGDEIKRVWHPIDELITLPNNQRNQQGISIKGAGFSPTPGKRKDGTPYLYAYNDQQSTTQYARKGIKLIKKHKD